LSGHQLTSRRTWKPALDPITEGIWERVGFHDFATYGGIKYTVMWQDPNSWISLVVVKKEVYILVFLFFSLIKGS
jgi:hypothetical protein